MVRQGGRYIVEKKGAKPKRVEWTRTPAEAAEEARKAERKTPPAKSAAKARPAASAAKAPSKAASETLENGSNGT